MKLTKKIQTLFILMILTMSIVISSLESKVYANSPDDVLEVYFTLNGQRNITKQDFVDNIQTETWGSLIVLELMLKPVNGQSMPVNAMGFFMDDNDVIKSIDLITPVKGKDDRGRDVDIWNVQASSSYSTPPGLIFNIIRSIPGEFDIPAEDYKLGDVEFLVDPANIPDDLAITLRYDDFGSDSFVYKADGSNVLLSPFVIGNPDAGPDASLSTLKVDGASENYLNLSGETLESNLSHQVTISYADSINNNLSFIYETLRGDATVSYVDEYEPKTTYNDGDIVKIEVIHEGLTKTYEIKINVTDPNDNANLELDIITKGQGKVVSKSEPDERNNINITVSYSTTELEIFPIIHELSTTDKEKLVFSNLEPGTDKTISQTIEVTAEDGETKNNYKINVTREIPNDNSNYKLYVDGVEIEYKDGKYSYLLDESKENFIVKINDFHDTAKFEYKIASGNFQPLTSGIITNNNINKGQTIEYTIKIITEANSEVERKVEIKRPESSNANLKDITITEVDRSQTNTSNPSRINNTYTYVVSYSNTGNIFLTGKGIANENATVSFIYNDNAVSQISTNSLNYGENEITIRVTAQNSENTSEYRLVIKKLSDKKELINISLKNNNSSGSIIADGYSTITENRKFYFDGKDTYSISIPYGNVSTFYLRLESSEKSIIELNNSKSSNNITTKTDSFGALTLETITYTLKIYDEKSNNTSNPNPATYIIKINREAADVNNKLEDIKVNEVSVNGFNSDTNSYPRQVFNRGTVSVFIEGILPEDSHAEVKYEYIVNNVKYESQTIPLNGTTPVKVKITVTSQSGDNRVYSLEFVAGSDDNKITSISLSNTNGYKFNFSFLENTKSYSITVPFTVTDVIVKAIASEGATISGARDYVLVQGQNTIKVFATSELNTKGDEYIININRQEGRNHKELSQLTYSITGFEQYSFHLQTNKFIYEAQEIYNRTIKSVDIYASIAGNDGEKFADVDGLVFEKTYELKAGENRLSFDVLDELGNRQTYTVVIDIYDDINSFDTIDIDNIEYDLSNFTNNQLIIEKEYLFNDGDVRFVVNKDSIYSELIITANNNAKYHTTPGYGMLDFKAGGTTIVTFRIKAENGIESEVYEVHITKLPANTNTNLNELNISLPNGTNIYSETSLTGNNIINLRVDRNISSINIEASLLQTQRSIISGLTLDKDNQTTDYSKYTQTINLSSAGTTSIYTFEVVAEDGITKSKYTINVIRKNIDSEVTNLIIKNGENTIHDGKYEDIRLPEFINSVNSLTFILTVNDPFARVFVGNSQRSGVNGVFEFSVSLLEGENNLINLRVETELLSTDTPSDGHSSNNAQITYSRKAARTTALLDTLTITYNNGNNILVSFTSEDPIPTIIEGLNLVRDIKSVVITATAKDGGTISGSTGSRNLTPGGTSSFSLQVTPENKGEGREYTIYISNKNEENTITDITIDGKSINFDKGTYLYDFTGTPYPYTKANIDIFVESDTYATITNSGIKQLNYNLADGINEFKIYATSEHGEKGHEYIVRVKVIPPYENTNLESLVVTDEKGTTLSFSTGEYTQGYFSYTINLEPNQVISQINILAVLLNIEKQSFDRDLSIPIDVVINSDGTVDQTITFTVTAENNKESVYSIRISKGLVLSDENKITSISLSNTNGYKFNFSFLENTKSYSITVPFTVTDVIVKAIASEGATISGARDYVLVQGQNTIKVFATSELNTKGDEYIININRQEGRNHKELSQLTYSITGFEQYSFHLQTNKFIYEAQEIYNRTIKSVDIYASIAGNDGEKFADVDGLVFEKTYELKAGENRLSFDVLDELGNRQTYTVVIDIYDDINSFDTIDIDNIEYDLSNFTNNQLIIEKEYLFNDGDVRFVVNKDSIYSELIITANNNAKYHTTPGYGMLDFKAGGTTIVTFRIKAENGIESEVYEVHITKLPANTNTNLNELNISLPNGTNIYSETSLTGNNIINLRVDRNISSINIEASLLQTQRSIISGLTLDKDNQTTDYSKYTQTINLSSAGTTSIYTFEVVAEDGITKSKYTINVIRKNIDSEVTNLIIKNGENTIHDGKYEDIRLPEFINSVNSLTFILTVNDPFARVFVGNSQRSGVNGVFEFSVSLLEGENNLINLRVETELLSTDTPSDGHSSNNAQITYSRKVARTTALLDTLTITYNNGNNILVSFTSEDPIPTIIEGLNLVRDIKSVVITATAKDGGTISGSTGSRNLTPGGTSSFSLQVTPENKGEGREYTIYISNKNEENTITDITIDGKSINFDKGTYLYDFTGTPYPYTKANIDIFVESDTYATITNSGIKQLNYNLADGINEFKIYATSEHGEKGHEYIVRVKVIPPYENTNLESLVVTDEKGTTLSFSTGEYTQGYFSYTINLEPNQVISQINILAVLLNIEKQSFDRDLSIPIDVVINSDGTVDQTITFTVTAENNKESVYSIRISKGLVLSDENEISDIKIISATDFIFNQETTEYSITVPYSIEWITPQVKASEKTTIRGNNTHILNVGETVITVYAISESGKEGTKYTITVTRLEASTNSYLDEIAINTTDNTSKYLLGKESRNPQITFNKETNQYEINLGIEYLGKIIRVILVKGHDHQQIRMFNITDNTKLLVNGENQFSILVTAEDTDSSNTYNVVINVKNETNDLDQLTINGDNINFKEDPIKPYVTENKTATITFKGLNNGEVILQDSNNNIITSGSTVSLNDGNNEFTIIVKNEYGEEVEQYEFIITRNPSKDTSITDAILFDSTNKNYLNFNENTIEYNISVASNIDKLTLNVSANHPLAVVTGNGTYNIKLDETTTIEFYITAEDGVTVSDTYVINVLRESLSTNQYLDEITIRTLDSTYILGNTFRNPMEEFVHDSQLQTINLDIDYVGKSLIVGYTKGHNNQKVTLIGLVNNTTLILKEGLNTFSIDIQPEDTTAETFVYTININVRNKHNDLDYLKINDELINLDNESIEIETEDESILIDYKPINNGKVTIKDKDGNEISNKLDLDYGDNLITIVIENEYNEVVKEYEINIIRNKSSNNNILDVILNDNENNNYLSFDKDIFEYEITIPYYVDNINLLINAEHYLANTYINNVLTNTANFELIAGEELTVNFYVIAENGDESTHYTIHIIRDYNTDNKLASLTTTTNIKTLLDVDFDKEIYYYYFQVNEEHELVIFDFELNYGQTVINIISGVAHSLNHGLNTFEIEVIAEDPNTDSSVYVIEIEMINSSVEIEEILVDNKDIYEEGKTNYILDAVSSDINEIELIVNPKDNNADVVITVEGKVITDGLIKLVPGQNEVIVTITSEDGTNVEEYTITIEQLLETYDLLDELIIKTNKETYLLGLEDKEPEVLFNAETFTYSITVNETVEFIKMNYVLGSQKQTIIGDFDVELNINHGLTTFIVEVYPEDSTLEGNIYKIEITKVDENIDLETLLVDGEDIYIENTTSYELDNLTTDTKSIIVIPTLTNEYGKYEIKDNNGNIITNNEVPVYFGNNKITITLTSEDGSVTKEYTINFEQVLSSNNEVIDLEVIDLANNVNKIIFDNNTLTYDVKFNYSSENARIRITTNDKATVYINELYKANAREDFTLIPGESRLIAVYIEAEDGTKGEIYKVNIYRMTEDEGRMSDNNKLRDLKLEIPLDEIPFNFEQNKLEYTIRVPYTAEEIYLKGYPEHHGATVHNEGAYRLEVGSNDPIYIRVQAEDGTPSRIQYKVTFVREEPNTDTSLKDLVVKDLNGNVLEFDNNVKFDSDNRIYTITLDKESYINQVRIDTVLNNQTQSIFGNGVVSLHGEIEGQYNTVLPVTVVAEDGSSEDYIIYILHDLDFSNITEIKDISIIGDDRISYFGLEFEGDIYNYDVYVPFNVLETRLIVQTLGNVIYLDNNDKEIDDNRLQQFNSDNLIVYRFKVKSMNEQNESPVYEINVIREVADSNALLETILIDGKEILDFDPLVNNYEYIQFILDPNKVDILAKPQSETSLVNGNKTYTLIEGESTFISIVVTAQDKTTNTYIVEVKYVNSNALLGELSVYELDEFGNEFQIPIELKPGEFNYTVQIDKNINLINIKGSGEDQGGARLRGFGQYRIGETDLVIPITVTSGDGKEERTYLVTITKSMRGDASLETVLINDGNENIIYDFTAPYKVSNDTNVVTLSAKAKDGNARVYFNDEYSSNGQFNINNLEPGQTSVLIRVESEDGQTIKTYVVNLAKDYQPDLLLTILLITSLLLWIITILILIIRKNRKKKVDDNQLIF